MPRGMSITVGVKNHLNLTLVGHYITYNPMMTTRISFAHYWPFVMGIHRSPLYHSQPHDDITKKLSALLALCEGNTPVTGGFPSQRARNVGAFMFSLFSTPTSCWTNSIIAGDLRCHNAYMTSLYLLRRGGWGGRGWGSVLTWIHHLLGK